MIDSSTQSQDGQQAVQLLTLLRQLQSENNETRDNGEKILNQIKYDFLLQQTESILFANEGVSDSEKIFLSTILKNRLPGFGTRSKKEMLSKNAFETLLKVFFNLKNLPSSDVQTNFDIFDHLVIPALRMIGHKDYSSSKNEFFNKLSENLDTTGSLLSPIMSFGVYSQCDEDLVKDHVVSILPQVYETQQKIATIITGVNVMDSNSTILTIQYFSYLCNLLAKMPQGVKPVEMLVSLINICQYLIVNKKIENSSQMIDSLQELAVVKPRLFKQVIQDVINLIIYVMKDSKNNHMIKISAINLFILLYTGLSQTMCKYEQELNEFVSHLAYCMTIPVEFSEKMPNLQTTNNDTQEYDENDQDDKYEMDMEHISRQAEVAFDKMCCLTPDFMYPKVEEYVSKYLSSDSTEDQKVGGLSMLCCAAEGCKKFYEKFLERIMNVLVFPYTYESQYSSKVRYTALTALGQMCSDFGASLIRKMHSEMLQTYKKALENSSSLKVQCFAYTALNNFISVCPSYLIDEVVEFLNPTIQKTLSQEPFSLNLFTNIIDFLIPLTETQAVIPPYLYLTVRPTILQVIQQYGSQDLNLLSKSLLTLCQLGMHAEKIKFQEDARMVMDCSMNVLQTSLRSNSHSNIDFENFIISFEVMVKVFGQDFLPYVDFMIQICKELMEEVFSTNYDKFMNYLESEDVEGEVESLFKANIIQFNEAIQSCQLLSTIFSTFDLNDPSISNHTQSLISLLVKLCSVRYSPQLKSVSFSALSSMVLKMNESSMQALMADYIKLSVQILQDVNSEGSALYNVVIALITFFEKFGSSALNEQLIGVYSQIMSKLVDNEISNSKEKASKLFFKKNEEIDDMDIYDYYEDEDEDESFLYVVDHFTCGMFSLLGEKYIPAFQSYESKIDHFIGDLNLQLVEDDVHSALLIYISIIEKAQDAVLSSYSSKFSDILLKFLNQPHRPTLFHAAVYGFGIIAKKNLPQYREFLIAAIPKVIEFVQSNAKNIDEDEPVLLAYENAISALIRVVRYADFILPSDDSEKRRLQYLILTNLPFKADTAELANCYEWICLLVQNQGESLQNDSQTFEQILRILLESYTFSRQNIENSLMNQVKICLQNLSRLNNFQPMLMKLSSSHQNAYKTIISNDKASNM